MGSKVVYYTFQVKQILDTEMKQFILDDGLYSFKYCVDSK